jgi:uncharacterized membrane protein
MSRAITPPERPVGAGASVTATSLRWSVALYSLYPVAVCTALAAGRPRLALAATLLALAAVCLPVPHWRRLGYAALVATPVLLVAAIAEFAQPLVFLPPIALNLGLAVLFGRTLRAGREPLISTFARAERGTLEPDLARYTRRLTAVWVAFFVGAALLSTGLAIAASPAVWGWFVAIGNHLGVAALFLGEYAFRRWRFPQYRHASPATLARILATRWRRPVTKQ